MTRENTIKTAFERNVKAVSLRPSVGQRTAVLKVRVRDGVKCDIEEGPWKLTADLNKAEGGKEAGPPPGVLGRAALGSCLAIGYVQRAAKLGVPISGVEVEVQTDSDVRGRYGLAELPAGYVQVRYTVTVETTASEADVMRVLDNADAHSPYVDVFRRAQDLRREVRIVRRES